MSVLRIRHPEYGYVEFHNLSIRQKDILDNSEKIVWIGYEDDTIHTYFPKTITIPNYYEWKNNRPFTGVLSNRVGYAARCETRKNAHYLDSIPSFVKFCGIGNSRTIIGNLSCNNSSNFSKL